MKLRRFFLLILIIGFSVSCGSKKKVANRQKEAQISQSADKNIESPVGILEKDNSVKKEDPVKIYIETYAQIAKDEMKLYKIPASITLAQGILESGAGKGRLSLIANNHFGIKCHEWKGAKVFHDDDARQECFRKYKDPKYSYRDHSLFLVERVRYADLFNLKPDDYQAWAKGLKKAGYATDRAYPSKLVSLIERYQLYKYDDEVLGKPSYASKYKEAASSYVVQKGDTLYSIARRYNTTVDTLKEYNNLNGSNIAEGQLLYVKLQ